MKVDIFDLPPSDPELVVDLIEKEHLLLTLGGHVIVKRSSLHFASVFTTIADWISGIKGEQYVEKELNQVEAEHNVSLGLEETLFVGYNLEEGAIYHVQKLISTFTQDGSFSWNHWGHLVTKVTKNDVKLRTSLTILDVAEAEKRFRAIDGMIDLGPFIIWS